jgi:Trypsin-like peptidase domain
MRFVITASIGEAGLNMKKIVLSACVLIIASATAEAADTFSGSGVVIGTQGEILTNAHVVEACTEITVRFPPGNLERAGLVARDERNDLAVVRATGANTVATFRDGSPVRAGDAVVALGYPLSGLLATSPSVSIGNVSALAGLLDDSRYLQISAPVQPGNSGGPLLDASGHLIGVVTAKLNAVRVAKFTGDIPQNVNFALKAEVVRTFLDSKGIAYRKAPSDQQLSPADVGDIARPFTVHIECQQTDSRVAAAPATPLPKNPGEPGSQSSHAPTPGTQTATTMAQKVVLYEEDTTDPNGHKFFGSVTWRTEKMMAGTGRPPELTIRADIEVPERKLVMTWSLRRNLNKALPASHLVEISFKRAAGSRSGDISNVPGMLMKPEEQAHGVSFSGFVAKASKDFFLIGLSSPVAEKDRNLKLLKLGRWFDVPIVYNDNHRAILAIEKGTSGERIFAQAFEAWQRAEDMTASGPAPRQ